jgi:hypothetical protein
VDADAEEATMKMQLPILNTAAVWFIDVMPPEPMLGQTKQQKADANGEPPYWIGQEGGETLNVKVPRTPPAGIRQGMPVTVKRPMVTDWAIGDRFGRRYRAAKVEPVSAADAETGRQAQQWWATGWSR